MEGSDNYIWETYGTKLRDTIAAHQKIGIPMMLRRFLAKGWMEAIEETGVSSPERKMNALQKMVWSEIMDPI